MGVHAYLFWHRPADGADGYEGALAEFHSSLAAAPPRGFLGSWSLRLDSPPWFAPGARCYLDWYVVESFAALEELNATAVSPTSRDPHDRVAAMAGAGTGGVLRLLGEHEPLATASSLLFFDRPAAVGRAEFVAGLEAGAATCWMRQMTLGPGPEFVLVDDGVERHRAAAAHRVAVHATIR